MAADYIYRNADDSMRARVFSRERGHWDFDLYDRATGRFTTFSKEAGDILRTKREALDVLAAEYGITRSINPQGSWT